jgi:hypothetical protein
MTEQKPIKLTAADRTLVEGDGVDLPIYEKSRAGIVQTNSPELVRDPTNKRFIDGAAAGDFFAFFGEHKTFFKGPTGFLCQVIGFSHAFNEYLPGHGPFVTAHDEKPGDAQWLKIGVPKEGLYRVNGDGLPGNHIVEIVYAYLLIGGRGAVYPFYGTACPIGHDFASRAQRLHVKVEIDGKIEEVRGPTLGKFQFTSYLDKKGDKRWYKPNVTCACKLGEVGGVTIEEWRRAQRLRQAFKRGLDWAPLEALDPPTPPAEALPPRQGSIEVRSDKDVWRDNAPPPDRYDGPDDDDPTF